MKKLCTLAIALGFIAILLAAAPLTKGDAVYTDLIAGQDRDVGTVKVWTDVDYLYVKYVIDFPWAMSCTHMHAADDVAAIPQNNGNPTPGHFDNTASHRWWQRYFIYKVDLDPSWTSGTDVYVAAHACVYSILGCSDSAWGDGDDFSGANWAMYITYTMP